MKQILRKITTILKNKISAYPKLTSLLCGIALSFALPPFYQFWLLVASFATVMYLCCRTSSKINLAGIGYWFGFGYFASGLYWIGNALLIDVSQTGWLYVPVLVANGLFFGLFTILPCVATKYGKNTYAKILLFAAIWGLITEWLRSFLFTGFPWNPISSTLAFRPALLQTLAWWGTYGLSAIVIIIACLPVVWIINPRRKTLISIGISFVLFFLLWEYGAYTLARVQHIPDGKSIMIRLVQPSIPQILKWDEAARENNLKEYINLSVAKDNRYIDFVIWGETASPFDLTYDLQHVRKVQQAIPRHGYLITGLLRYGAVEHGYMPYNSLAVITKKGKIWDIYDKNHLVPFGEYIPFRTYLPDWVRPIANNVSEFGRGEKFKTITIDGYPEFAPLICYEIIFSDDVVRKENKPQWAIVLTNDGWYGDSAGPYQHFVAAQMRAVEEGITIVRSANSGISGVITPYGEIVKKILLGKKDFADIPIKLDLAHETLFGKYGNAIPLSMFLALIILAQLLSLYKDE